MRKILEGSNQVKWVLLLAAMTGSLPSCKSIEQKRLSMEAKHFQTPQSQQKKTFWNSGKRLPTFNDSEPWVLAKNSRNRNGTPARTH